MTGLTRDARALIEASRLHERIRISDKARIRRKLMHRLGTTAAVGSVISTAVAAAEAARAAAPVTLWAITPTAIKTLAVVVCVGAATAGGVAASGSVAAWRLGAPAHAVSVPSAQPIIATSVPAAGSPAQPIIATSVPAAGSPAQPTIATSVPAAGSPAQPTIAATPGPAAVVSAAGMTAPSAPRIQKQVTRARAASTQPELGPDTDVRLLQQANGIRNVRAALQRGDAVAALSTLDAAVPLGNGGDLEQEALFLRVAAYCQLGDVGRAKRFAQLFLSSHAGSLLEPRVRSSCAFEAPSQR